MYKGFARFIRIIGCLAGAIQLIAAIYTLEHSYELNIWSFLVSLVLAAVTPVLALSYAKMIDTTLENAEDIRWMKESLEKQLSSQQKPASVQPILDPERPGFVTCPCCGKLQKDNRVSCLDCGVPFV